MPAPFSTGKGKGKIAGNRRFVGTWGRPPGTQRATFLELDRVNEQLFDLVPPHPRTFRHSPAIRAARFMAVGILGGADIHADFAIGANRRRRARFR